MILFPTKGRPLSARRFFTHYCLTGGTGKGVMILEKENEKAYDQVGLPPGWIVRVFEGGKGAASHHNKIFQEFPNELYYASLADDVVPESDNWETIMIFACLPDKVAVPNEGISRLTTHGVVHFPTHPFIGGDLVRKWGFIVPPVLDHFYCDNWWLDAGEQVVLPDVKLTHYHFKNKLAVKDETYLGRPHPLAEEVKYLDFCRENQHLLYRKQITLHRKKIAL